MENILGIDIGGSKIRMVLWDGLKVLKVWQSETANLQNLKKGVEFFSGVSRALGSANFKVGIGLPGLLNFEKGQALFCKNLPKFNNVNLQAFFPAKIKFDNDAKCFLKAELFFYKGKVSQNVLGVIFGTGIGGAVSISNIKSQIANIYYGRDGWAGEFGHMIIDKGKTWEKLYQETKTKPKEQEKINSIGFASLINIFNPEIIFLGGRGVKKPNLKLIEKYLLIKKQMPKFVLTKLGENAVAVGAALLWE